MIKDLFKEVFRRFEYTGVEICRKMLRYYEEPEDVELRYCELVDERRFSDRCAERARWYYAMWLLEKRHNVKMIKLPDELSVRHPELLEDTLKEVVKNNCG